MDIKYHLSFAHSEVTETFDSPEKAGAAFYWANAADRPRIIRGNERTAQTIAKTMMIGETPTKSLPFETDSAFTEAYQEERAKDAIPDFPLAGN